MYQHALCLRRTVISFLIRKQPHCLIFINIGAPLFLWMLIFTVGSVECPGLRMEAHDQALRRVRTTSCGLHNKYIMRHKGISHLSSWTDTGCSHARMCVVLLCSTSGLQRTNKHYTRLMERLQLHKNNMYKQGQRAKSINLRGFRAFSGKMSKIGHIWHLFNLKNLTFLSFTLKVFI